MSIKPPSICITCCSTLSMWGSFQCKECAESVKERYRQRRLAELKSRFIICMDCGKKEHKRYRRRFQRCRSCQRIHERIQQRARNKVRARKYPNQRRALQAVAHAKRKGMLKWVGKGCGIKCTDCHREARHYDHRDYSKPLDVDPVCVDCNIKRGPALNRV